MLCGIEVRGISSKALTLKSPPLAAINTMSGADRSLHKWFQNAVPPPKGRAFGSRNPDSSLPKPPDTLEVELLSDIGRLRRFNIFDEARAAVDGKGKGVRVAFLPPPCLLYRL